MGYGKSQLASIQNQFVHAFFEWLHDGKDAGESREGLEYVHNLNDSKIFPAGFTSSDATALTKLIHKDLSKWGSTGKAWLRIERKFNDDGYTDSVSIVALFYA